MSELRVDNIVSEDGSAAPIYSKGMSIGAGQTLTCSGDFSVGGNVTFDSGATVTGVVTFSSADLQANISLTTLSVSGVSSVGSAITMYGTSGIVSATSYYGDGSNLTGIDATQIINGTSNVAVSAASSITFTTDGVARAFVNSTGHFDPAGNNTYDLGNTNNRWRNVYTNDLNLSNEGGANDVDGTWGSWTIQEGEDDLFLLNRRNGKKYKFNLSEVN